MQVNHTAIATPGVPDKICLGCHRLFIWTPQEFRQDPHRCLTCARAAARAAKKATAERNPAAYAKSRERVRQSVARLTARYKTPVLRHYSGDDPCCACCGEREPLFLAVDHINGGGTQERKRLGVSAGYQFYRWLVENDFPTGYQILCQNCNGAKGSGFLCPHEVARRGLTGRVRVGGT